MKEQYLRYQYRIYPTKQQEQKLKQFCGTTRYVWNHFLGHNIAHHKEHGKFIFYHDMAGLLTKLKKQLPWLKNTHSQVLQQKLKDLDTALNNCIKHKRGFPKFKCKSNFSDSFRYQQGIKHEKNKVYLPKIGWVKEKTHRPLPSTPKTTTIIMDGDKWFISYVVKKNCESPVKVTNEVGLDLGIKDFLVTSDNVYYENPKFLDRSLKKLQRKQRQLSRKKKGSNNRKKQQLVVYKQHQKIRFQRHDYLHQISSQITNDYDLICMEDLNVSGMIKNRKLSRQIGQIGWGMFLNMIMYKSELKGKHTVKIDRFAPSSKTCSSCGKKHDISLADRVITCDCGHIMNRDLNAAINIRDWGTFKFNTSGTGEINACGVSPVDGNIDTDTLKQEAMSFRAW